MSQQYRAGRLPGAASARRSFGRTTSNTSSVSTSSSCKRAMMDVTLSLEGGPARSNGCLACSAANGIRRSPSTSSVFPPSVGGGTKSILRRSKSANTLQRLLGCDECKKREASLKEGAGGGADDIEYIWSKVYPPPPKPFLYSPSQQNKKEPDLSSAGRTFKDDRASHDSELTPLKTTSSASAGAATSAVPARCPAPAETPMEIDLSPPPQKLPAWVLWRSSATNEMDVFPMNHALPPYSATTTTSDVESLLHRLYDAFQSMNFQARHDLTLKSTFSLLLTTSTSTSTQAGEQEVHLVLHLWYKDHLRSALLVELDMDRRQRGVSFFPEVAVMRLLSVVSSSSSSSSCTFGESSAGPSSAGLHKRDRDASAAVVPSSNANSSTREEEEAAAATRKKKKPKEEKETTQKHTTTSCGSRSGGVFGKNARELPPEDKADFGRGPIKPTVRDCLLGRGKVFHSRQGNKEFHTIVKSFAKEYNEAKSNKEKGDIVERIMKELEDNEINVVVAVHYLVLHNVMDQKIRDVLRSAKKGSRN